MDTFTIIKHVILRFMAEKADPMSSRIDRLLEAISDNPLLQQNMRMAITAEAVCEVARAADIEITPSDLVKYYATLLTNASDAVAVENFNICSWDVGELLWAMRQWKS